MKLALITFSPTGGTQKVADLLGEEWGGTIERVDLTDSGANLGQVTLTEEDVAIIAMPSYGGRVPGLAAERLKAVSGGGARGILVCVYGNRAYEDTLVEMEDLAREAGFRPVAALATVAEHSIMHQYATGRPDAEDGAELRAFVGKIKARCDSNTGAADLHLPGNRPYKKAAGAGIIPKAGKACVSCGQCAEKCPAQAISRENPKVTDRAKCIGCMRCVALCPQSARQPSKIMVSVAAMALKKACSVRKGSELYLPNP